MGFCNREQLHSGFCANYYWDELDHSSMCSELIKMFYVCMLHCNYRGVWNSQPWKRNSPCKGCQWKLWEKFLILCDETTLEAQKFRDLVWLCSTGCHLGHTIYSLWASGFLFLTWGAWTVPRACQDHCLYWYFQSIEDQDQTAYRAILPLTSQVPELKLWSSHHEYLRRQTVLETNPLQKISWRCVFTR